MYTGEGAWRENAQDYTAERLRQPEIMRSLAFSSGLEISLSLTLMAISKQ